MKHYITAAAAALLLSGTSLVSAQQRGPDDKGPPSQQNARPTPGQERGQAEPRRGQQPDAGQRQGASPRAEPAQKGAGSERAAEPRKANPGAAQKADPKDRRDRGTAQKADPTDRPDRGTAQKADPKDRPDRGTAQKADPKDKAARGAADKSERPNDQSGKAATRDKRDADRRADPSTPKGKGTAADDRKGSSERVQVPDEQRRSAARALFQEKRVNRVSNVNVSINVGTRVPRTTRLAVLPPSILSIAPAYRSYRYFAVEDRVVIVEPATYEIVDVIEVRERSAATGGGGGGARLVLSDSERNIIVRSIDVRGPSTLGLGVLTLGEAVPRQVELREFPTTVVERVPKIKGYEFIVVEDRIGIVDPSSMRVEVIVERDR